MSHLSQQPLDLLGLFEIDGEGARPELLGERLEDVHASSGQDELDAAAVQGTGNRVPDASGGACQEGCSAG
jgi:hypothetical protein